MEEFLKAVANFGFPIVLSAYLLIRFEGRIADQAKEVAATRTEMADFKNKMVTSLGDLKEEITKLCDRVR